MADNNDEANTIKLSDSVGKANPVTFSLDQKPPTKQKLKLKKLDQKKEKVFLLLVLYAYYLVVVSLLGLMQ